MRRVLLLPSPPNSGSMGSVIKLIGIAKKLRDLGHTVAFVMGGSLVQLIKRENFLVYPYPIPQNKGFVEDIKNAIDFFNWTGMMDMDFFSQAIKDEVQAIRCFKPDVLFSETRLSASISASITGTPLFSIACWPCSPRFSINNIDENHQICEVNKVLKNYGVPAINNVTELVYSRADKKIAPTIPILEPELAEEPDVIFTGYILDLNYDEQSVPDWLKKESDKPLIFVYPSVGALQPHLYSRLLSETFDGSSYRVICACGYHKEIQELPADTPNVRFVRYIPSPMVLERASMVIFHGGQDSMLSNLLYGIPSIAIPGKHFEREYNTANLVKAEAALHLPVYGFRKNRLLKATEEVLHGQYREKCKSLSCLLKSYGGTDMCIDMIVSF